MTWSNKPLKYTAGRRDEGRPRDEREGFSAPLFLTRGGSVTLLRVG